jgi:hypothetical protein
MEVGVVSAWLIDRSDIAYILDWPAVDIDCSQTVGSKR